MMNDTDLLKTFKEVSVGEDTTSFDIFDYLHVVGSPLAALFYARLFWPEFMEMNGMIFLKETITDDESRTRLRKTLALYSGNTKQTEQAFNLVEVPYLFGK